MRLILGLLKWLFVAIVVVVAGGLAFMYLQDPVLTTRLVTVPFGAKSGPLERVAGGELIDIPTAEPGQRTVDQNVLDQLVAYGEQTGSHALIVYQGSAIQLEHYYPGYDADTLSPTQSMHKSVLAMLVGLAIEQGYIDSVDAKASRYLPEWADDARSAITIRQMLQQTSGIDFATVGFNPLGGFFQLMLGTDVTAAALHLPQEVEPGTRFDYNSAIPQNMGLIIRRATGRRYAEYLSEALWQHIGAPDAWVVLDSEQNRMPRTSCCLDATARAWLHVGMLHVTGGRIGGRQVVPEQWMRDIATGSRHNPNYGYFTWLGTEYEEYRYYNRKTSVRVWHSEPYLAPDVIFFDGFGGQRVYAVPSRKLVIVRTGSIANDWDDAYLVNTIIRGL